MRVNHDEWNGSDVLLRCHADYSGEKFGRLSVCLSVCLCDCLPACLCGCLSVEICHCQFTFPVALAFQVGCLFNWFLNKLTDSTTDLYQVLKEQVQLQVPQVPSLINIYANWPIKKHSELLKFWIFLYEANSAFRPFGVDRWVVGCN